MRTLASQPAAPWDPLPLPDRCLSDAFGSGQGNANGFIISSIRQTQICLINLFIFIYIMHKYNRHYCAYCTIPCVYCLLSVHHVHFHRFCMSRRFYNSGFSISGSCKAALCFSAICWAVCCGCPYCFTCSGAVSTILSTALHKNI